MFFRRLTTIIAFCAVIFYLGHCYADHWGTDTIANDGALDFFAEIVRGKSK